MSVRRNANELNTTEQDAFVKPLGYCEGGTR